MWHRHCWEERRFYTPPYPGNWNGYSTQEVLERMAHGFTVVEKHCYCGKVKFRYVLGDVRLGEEEKMP